MDGGSSGDTREPSSSVDFHFLQVKRVGLGELHSHITGGCVPQVYHQGFGAEDLSGVVIDHSPITGIVREQNTELRRALVEERLLAIENSRAFEGIRAAQVNFPPRANQATETMRRNG
jgi:hypothetical protein